jgi:hypothetical protein
MSAGCQLFDKDSGIGWSKLDSEVFAITKSKSSNCVVKEMSEVQFYDIAASAIIMSGLVRNGPVIVASSEDGIHFKYAITNVVFGVVHKDFHPCDPAPVVNLPIVAFGGFVKNPSLVSEFCRRHPRSLVYICPFSHGFGTLATACGFRVSSVPVVLFPDNLDDLPFPSVEFDKTLNADAEGNMAVCVSKGYFAINQLSSIIPDAGIWFGWVLCGKFSTYNPSFIVSRPALTTLFKNLSKSESCAAETVGLLVRNTDEFKKASGCDSDTITIMTAGKIESMWNFMSFYSGFSGGKQFVPVSTAGGVELKNATLFRRNKMYQVKSSEIKGAK